MPKYRRSRLVLITFEELESTEPAPSTSLVLTSIISGQHLLVDSNEIERIRQVPCEEWSCAEFVQSRGFSAGRIEEFVQLGIFHRQLSGESAASTEGGFLEREEIVEASHWPPCAAAFHLLNHHQESQNSPFGRVIDMSLQERESQERAIRFVEAHGTPPPEFYKTSETGALEYLPLERHVSPLTEILGRRRTCRYFQPERSIALRDLSSLLRLVFGPCGIRRVADQVNLLLKTSPSGGSLHPIEGFLIVFRCESLRSGVYHYRGDCHALAPMHEIAEEDLRRFAVYLAQGQDFVGSCSLVIVLVARFERNFWKYRCRENSYSVVLQDAGHISQTFQLAATDLGLATFYTGAINSEAITALLKLRYPAEAPVGILGVGSRSQQDEPPPLIEPFHPERHGV